MKTAPLVPPVSPVLQVLAVCPVCLAFPVSRVTVVSPVWTVAKEKLAPAARKARKEVPVLWAPSVRRYVLRFRPNCGSFSDDELDHFLFRPYGRVLLVLAVNAVAKVPPAPLVFAESTVWLVLPVPPYVTSSWKSLAFRSRWLLPSWNCDF